MKLVEMTVTGFVKELASNSPAPGGGSVAALAGSLAAGLASMVSELTVGREKFKDNEPMIKPLLTEGKELASELLDLIDADTESFNELMKAFKLPKGTDEEKAARSKAIQAATKVTIEVPLKTCEACAKAACLAKTAVTYGNPNAVTDGGSAAHMAMAGAIAASYNVRVNLLGFKDEAFSASVKDRIKKALETAEAAVADVKALLEKALA